MTTSAIDRLGTVGDLDKFAVLYLKTKVIHDRNIHWVQAAVLSDHWPLNALINHAVAIDASLVGGHLVNKTKGTLWCWGFDIVFVRSGM
ncbi:hypothetical protein D3C71_1845690 [compost metagenome]